MFDRNFFSTQLGKAAAVSVAAMVAFNIFALTHQLDARPVVVVSNAHMVELA